jgi:hypothetical protein
VQQDEMAVGGFPHINFHHIDMERRSFPDGDKGVLRGVTGKATMPDSENREDRSPPIRWSTRRVCVYMRSRGGAFFWSATLLPYLPDV